MRSLAIGLWKEWRDHRAVLLGVLGALAFLTTLGFLAFETRLGGGRPETLALLFLGVGALLLNLAVVADLWAGETRRGTLAVLQRLPHGLGSALLAKCLFLALAWLAVVCWQGLTLGVALEFTTPAPAAELFWAQFGTLRSFWWVLAALLWLPAPFVLAVSTWLGRSGAAILGAVVLLAALGLPFYLLIAAHPWSMWLFVENAGDAVRLGAGVAGVALLATLLSVLRGHRYAGRPLRPALWGVSVLLVALGGGLAQARSVVNRYLEFGPHDSGVQVLHAYVGAGERFLYVDVARAAPDAQGEAVQWGHSRRATPVQSWIVDLHEGSHRRLTGAHHTTHFSSVPDAWPSMGYGAGAGASLAPAEALVLYEASDEDISAVQWLDAREGVVRRVLPSQTADGVTDSLTRRVLSEATWLRDPQGRRLWSREGKIEWEGDDWAPAERIRRRDPYRKRLLPAPGGWLCWAPRKLGAVETPLEFRAPDGETVLWERRMSEVPWYSLLSADYTFAVRHERVRGEGKKWIQRTLPQLLSLPALEVVREVPNAPTQRLGPVAENTLLVLGGEGEETQLELWNPLTDESRVVRFEGQAPGRVDAGFVRGRAADGSLLVGLTRTQDGTNYQAWVQVAADLASARLLVSFGPRGTEWPIAFLPDGTLYVQSDHRAVLRFGLTRDGQRTGGRVFPR